MIMRGVTHAHSCMHSIGVAIISGTMIPLRVMPLGAKAPTWEHQQFEIMTLPAHSLQGASIFAGLSRLVMQEPNQ